MLKEFFKLLFTVLLFTSTLLFLSNCTGPAGPDGGDAVLSDSIPPVINWVFPPSEFEVNTVCTLAVSAYDENSIWKLVFYIGGFEFDYNLALSDTTNGAFKYRWDVAHFPEGLYPISSRVWDHARNSSTTPTRWVTVKR